VYHQGGIPPALIRLADGHQPLSNEAKVRSDEGKIPRSSNRLSVGVHELFNER
jgi:hypothetical protein